MKYLFILFLSTTLNFYSFSQADKANFEKIPTKIDGFLSKKGSIIRYIDYKLNDLKGTYGIAETRVRHFTSSTNPAFFLQISQAGKYSTSTASIDYNDLLEVIKAFYVLKEDVTKDLSLNPDYLENKFVGNDDFQLGYFVNKDDGSWYLKLERFGTENTFFFKNGNDIEALFLQAKQKIEDLKKK